MREDTRMSNSCRASVTVRWRARSARPGTWENVHPGHEFLLYRINYDAAVKCLVCQSKGIIVVIAEEEVFSQITRNKWNFSEDFRSV